METRTHFIAPEIYNPLNPLDIALIGVGGTGSHMLTALSKINHALQQLGHPGINLTVFDDDVVTRANIARQLFSASEIGLNKGVALINRVNRFFGSSWIAKEEKFPISKFINYNVIISCVDNVGTRIAISQEIKSTPIPCKPKYWMDFGNSKETGQVYLSTVGHIPQPKSKLFHPVGKLPLITEEYPILLAESEDNDSPSCSLAEALEKQDLFINPSLADLGASLLWKVFRNIQIDVRGIFMNLDNFTTKPIPV